MPQYAAKKKKSLHILLIFIFSTSTHCFYFYPIASKQKNEHNIQQLRWAFLLYWGSDEFNRQRFSDFLITSHPALQLI